MYKFRIVIDVIEDEDGIHQNNTVKSVDDGSYNGLVVLGALEQAKTVLCADIQNATKKE